MALSLESVGTTISAHLTDEAECLKVVESAQFDFLLRLNLLFFDQLAIPIVGILNNPSFESLISNHPALALRLFKTSETGFIRPIAFHYDNDDKVRNPLEIVEKLLTRSQRIYLSKDKLYGMANFIMEAKPETFYTGDAAFRSRYHSDLMEITAFINQEGLQAGQSNAPLLPKNSLHKLNEWLHATDAKRCNCTDAFEVINGSAILNDPRKKKEAKIVAAATWMHSIRGSMVGSLSVPSEYLPVVECFRRLGLISNATILKNVEPIEFPISVPFGAISHLPLPAILDLRDLDTFRNIRDILSRHRMSGESVSHEQIRKEIDKCRDKLLEFERRGRYRSSDGLDVWKQVVAEINKKETNDRLKIWRDRATGILVSACILTTFCKPFAYLAAFIGGGQYLLGEHIERTEKALSTSLAPETKGDIEYLPVTGDFFDRECDGSDTE